MQLLSTFVTSLMLSSILAQSSRSARLISSHVLWRHGDRSPSDTYPSDPNQESAWPQGWSQLTQLGMRECYQLGVMLRDKYHTSWRLISSQYKMREVYVRSTNANRCLMSAQALLAGLYPPTGNQVWSGTIAWQPIPVHAKIPIEDDLLLKLSTTNRAHCPAYNRVKKQIKRELESKFQAEQRDLIAVLKRYSGFKNISYGKALTVYSAAQKERIHHMPQPAWLDALFPTNTSQKTVFETLAQLNTQYSLTEDNNLTKAKYEAGYLLNDITERMKYFAEADRNGTLNAPVCDGYDCEGSTRRLVMYSTHSGTLTPLLVNMMVQMDFTLPFATALMFDLYYDAQTSDYYVQLSWSLDQHTRQIVPLKRCGGDGTLCPLRDFDTAYADRRFTSQHEWKRACSL